MRNDEFMESIFFVGSVVIIGVIIHFIAKFW